MLGLTVHITKNNFIILITLLSMIIPIGCGNITAPDRDDFVLEVISPNFRYNMFGNMVVDTKLGDTLDCALVFDTGGTGCLIFDSVFAGKIFPSYKQTGKPTNFKSGWNFHRDIPSWRVDKPVDIIIGDKNVHFDYFLVTDGKSLNLTDADGLLSIPKGDKRIWELDFKNKYIGIHDSCKKENVSLSLRLDTVDNYYIIRDFPFELPLARDTVRVLMDLMMDTGMPETVSYLYKRPDSIMQLAMNDSSARKYICPIRGDVQATIYKLQDCGFLKRDIWIEHRERVRPWNIMGEIEGVVAGLNFLKSFHIFIRLKDHCIDLTPSQYTSIEEELGNRMRSFRDKNGNAVIDFVRTGSFYANTGLSPGDIILSVDGTQLFKLPRNYFDSMRDSTQIHFIVLRDADTVKLTGYYSSN